MQQHVINRPRQHLLQVDGMYNDTHLRGPGVSNEEMGRRGEGGPQPKRLATPAHLEELKNEEVLVTGVVQDGVVDRPEHLLQGPQVKGRGGGGIYAYRSCKTLYACSSQTQYYSLIWQMMDLIVATHLQMKSVATLIRDVWDDNGVFELRQHLKGKFRYLVIVSRLHINPFRRPTRIYFVPVLVT